LDGLDGLLKELQLQISSAQPRLDPLNLSATERTWLLQLTPQELLSWQQAVQKAQLRMLSQGVVASLADRPLLLAARMHLDDQPLPGQSLGSRLVVRSLQGRTNLRSDHFLHQRRIEELLNQGLQELPVGEEKARLQRILHSPASDEFFGVTRTHYGGMVADFQRRLNGTAPVVEPAAP
jgi:hypothetical protein